jgi:hypothetical protein
VILRQIFERLQIDRPLAYALSTYIWQAISGPVTIALVIKFLSEDQTGIFYGLVTVVAIQGLFELGLLNVLIGHAGHAAAELKAASSGDSDAGRSREADARMRELIAASHRWFCGASLLFVGIALILGWHTFTNSDATTPWAAPLLVTVPLAALGVYFAPALAILEGTGDRELIYRFRFYQRFTGSFVVWAALVFGFGVWALAVSAFVQAFWSGYLPLVHRASFFRRFKKITDRPDNFSWSKDVVPAQWRAAVVSGAYHVATQLFTLILLNFHTTVEAGRLGMTLTATTALQMLALAWVQTKFSVIAVEHGKGNREAAGTLWRQTAAVSSGLLMIGFAVLTIVIAYLPSLQLILEGWGFKQRDLAARFITPTQCLILGAGCIANHLIAVQAFYVLARRANPFVVASVTGSLITAAAVWIGGYYFATTGIVVGYATATALVGLPLHSLAYLQYRTRPVV